jgi:cytoskeletal protein CcmA (bactofilin family)
MLFGKKKENYEKDVKAASINIVGLGTEINGDLITKGDIRVDGKITGNVKSKAKVVIGQTGEIIGNINAESAEVSGKVTGDVTTTEILFLKDTAILNGNVLANKLVVENGAFIKGFCETGISHTKSINNNHLDIEERSEPRREATA